MIAPVNNVAINNDVAPSHRLRQMDSMSNIEGIEQIVGVRYQKYRSIAIPLNIGIELSQVSRYFDIFCIEPALLRYSTYILRYPTYSICILWHPTYILWYSLILYLYILTPHLYTLILSDTLPVYFDTPPIYSVTLPVYSLRCCL